MISIGSNFFYTVTLPCTLWFMDKAKKALPPSPLTPLPKGEGQSFSPSGRDGREGHCVRGCDTVLFIDARHIYRQIDRAHRDFTPEQIEFIANIVRFYRGEKTENRHNSVALLKKYGFPLPLGEGKGESSDLPSTSGRVAGGEGYIDVPGLCKVATIAEIEAQGWSLNPGRYVGVADREEEDFDFIERLEELNEELEVLNSEARGLEDRIADNVTILLEKGIE